MLQFFACRIHWLQSKGFFFFKLHLYCACTGVKTKSFKNYFLSNAVQQPFMQHFHCISIRNHPGRVIGCRKGGCSLVAENLAGVWEALLSLSVPERQNENHLTKSVWGLFRLPGGFVPVTPNNQLHWDPNWGLWKPSVPNSLLLHHKPQKRVGFGRKDISRLHKDNRKNKHNRTRPIR